MPEFRTATGQTGEDAYAFEAAAIANAQRELDARFQRLVETVREERPDLFRHETDFMFAPAATNAKHFRAYLQGEAKEREYLDGLR